MSIAIASIVPTWTGTSYTVNIAGTVDTATVTGRLVIVGLYVPPAPQANTPIASTDVQAAVTPGSPASTWTAQITGIPPGTYNVRAAVTDSSQPPTIIEYVISSGLVLAVQTSD
jgi:hypothetical protein